MDEIKKFKNRIFLYSFVIAIIAWVISLLFLKLDLRFLYGLALGTCISVVNFNLLFFSSKQVLKRKKSILASISMVVRLMVYGFAFYMSVRISPVTGLGCVIGFLTQKLAIYYIYVVKTKFSTNRKISSALKREYEELDKENEEKKSWEVW